MELFGDFTYQEQTSSYKFTVTKIFNWKVDNQVIRVVGDHIDGKDNFSVTTVVFSNLRLNRCPRRIECFFPNLKVLMINSCGIKTLTKTDLKGLSLLRQFTFNGNEIALLSDDLFEETPGIEAISFYGNKIQFIGARFFDALPNLTYANFKLNVSIDACFKASGSGISLKELKELAKKNQQSADVFRKYFFDITNSNEQ